MVTSMKLIKLKISRDQNASRTHYTYPKEYDATKVRFGPFYESSLSENLVKVVARGNTDEFILFGVLDEDAPNFLVNPKAQKLSYDDALALGNTWTKQIERITNPNKTLAVVAKAVRGETLTQAEKAALDPNNQESGINKSKTFKDMLDEFLSTGK